MSTWLITGCSTGLGRALAEAVIAESRANEIAKWEKLTVGTNFDSWI